MGRGDLTFARTWPSWMLVIVVSLAAATTFGPWLRSGDAQRSSYEAVRSAARLELIEGPAADVVRPTWPFVPLLACLAVLALFLDRPVVAAVLATLVGVAVTALALVVSRSREHADWGATAGLLVGPVVVVSAMLLITTVRSGGPRARA